jgi:hypothetical protein
MTDSLLFQTENIDWPAIQAALFNAGVARLPAVAAPETCRALSALYGQDALFRKRIVMARHNFGQGEYAYFAYPLPAAIQALRETLYTGLAPIANRLMRALGHEASYPAALADFTVRCHAAGQTRPTPLMLRYHAGDYNRLHQDLYGETVFPLQAVLMLSAPGVDFQGGEFLLVENRPRQQSIGRVLNPAQGELLIFPVNDRPVQGARGYLRAAMRHGVSEISSGERTTLGIIFHDAA